MVDFLLDPVLNSNSEADFESCQGALSSQIPTPAPKIYTGFDDFQQSLMSFQAHVWVLKNEKKKIYRALFILIYWN